MSLSVASPPKHQYHYISARLKINLYVDAPAFYSREQGKAAEQRMCSKPGVHIWGSTTDLFPSPWGLHWGTSVRNVSTLIEALPFSQVMEGTPTSGRMECFSSSWLDTWDTSGGWASASCSWDNQSGPLWTFSSNLLDFFTFFLEYMAHCSLETFNKTRLCTSFALHASEMQSIWEHNIQILQPVLSDYGDKIPCMRSYRKHTVTK